MRSSPSPSSHTLLVATSTSRLMSSRPTILASRLSPRLTSASPPSRSPPASSGPTPSPSSSCLSARAQKPAITSSGSIAPSSRRLVAKVSSSKARLSSQQVCSSPPRLSLGLVTCFAPPRSSPRKPVTMLPRLLTRDITTTLTRQMPQKRLAALARAKHPVSHESPFWCRAQGEVGIGPISH